MAVNMMVLGDRTITPLVRHVCAHNRKHKHKNKSKSKANSQDDEDEDEEALVAEVKRIAQTEFSTFFWNEYNEVGSMLLRCFLLQLPSAKAD